MPVPQRGGRLGGILGELLGRGLSELGVPDAVTHRLAPSLAQEERAKEEFIINSVAPRILQRLSEGEDPTALAKEMAPIGERFGLEQTELASIMGAYAPSPTERQAIQEREMALDQKMAQETLRKRHLTAPMRVRTGAEPARALGSPVPGTAPGASITLDEAQTLRQDRGQAPFTQGTVSQLLGAGVGQFAGSEQRRTEDIELEQDIFKRNQAARREEIKFREQQVIEAERRAQDRTLSAEERASQRELAREMRADFRDFRSREFELEQEEKRFDRGIEEQRKQDARRFAAQLTGSGTYSQTHARQLSEAVHLGKKLPPHLANRVPAAERAQFEQYYNLAQSGQKVMLDASKRLQSIMGRARGSGDEAIPIEEIAGTIHDVNQQSLAGFAQAIEGEAGLSGRPIEEVAEDNLGRIRNALAMITQEGKIMRAHEAQALVASEGPGALAGRVPSAVIHERLGNTGLSIEFNPGTGTTRIVPTPKAGGDLSDFYLSGEESDAARDLAGLGRTLTGPGRALGEAAGDVLFGGADSVGEARARMQRDARALSDEDIAEAIKLMPHRHFPPAVKGQMLKTLREEQARRKRAIRRGAQR